MSYALRALDTSSLTVKELQEILSVFEYVFANDIHITFDPRLDADFNDLNGYYGKASGGAMIVAESCATKIIVGTIAIRRLEVGEEHRKACGVDANDTVCELKRMFLLPESRGKGLGHQLLARVMTEARAMGYNVVLLDTKRCLEAANALYAKLGFVECGNYNGNPRPDKFMMFRFS
jgi:GNAT superfamily N-acetyltransferase